MTIVRTILPFSEREKVMTLTYKNDLIASTFRTNWFGDLCFDVLDPMTNRIQNGKIRRENVALFVRGCQNVLVDRSNNRTWSITDEDYEDLLKVFKR